MLSLIICTRDPQALAAVSHSVEQTIGVPYEIVAIDNSQGKYGICEAYNVGAAQAHYELLCFMHEDIRFHTIGWGKVVASNLTDPTIGVLGITGGRYQVASPAAWWGCGLTLCRENVLNVFPDGHKEMDLRNPEAEVIADVAVVDGLWMCSRKEVWQKYPFDSSTFTEFHFYDVDYCTEIYKHGLRVCVSFELLVEHHSRGSVNTSWLHNAMKYEQKRKGQLPFGPAVLSAAEARRLEIPPLQEFINRLLSAGFPSRLILHYLRICLALDPLNADTLWLVRQWMRSIFSKSKKVLLPPAA
jgi:glycosyltransferase involved in cell wall biosynthesis